MPLHTRRPKHAAPRITIHIHAGVPRFGGAPWMGTAIVGTVNDWPHCGQVIVRPKRSSARMLVLPQWEHATLMGMVVTSIV